LFSDGGIGLDKKVAAAGRSKPGTATPEGTIMKIRFRLQELLEKHQGTERGIIKRISEATNLERHQVAAVYHNKAKYVSLDTLAAICQYLIEQHHIPRADLPGRLFQIEPEHFSMLVANRKFVELCVGMWTDKRKSKRAGAAKAKEDSAGLEGSGRRRRQRWVMASDTNLQGILLHELFGLGNENHPEFLEQQLVSALGGEVGLEEIKRQVASVYDAFQSRVEGPGLICLGSVKSNGVSEAVIAHAFHAEAFVSQDDVRAVKDRSVPFFLRYRNDDVKPPSCHGGLRLAQSKESVEPGIYYETPRGWKCCPSSVKEDVALVFYVYHSPKGRLEMVMGGFSGRATHCLAAGLPKIMGKLWPPSYNEGDRKVGAFIVRFKFTEPTAEENRPADKEWTYHPSATEVIALDKNVLARKLERRTSG
jgi:hypothetical protein